MPFTTNVNLPRSHSPKWPNLCILCSEESPKGTTCYRSHTQSWITFLSGFREEVSIEVPACPHCRRSLWILAFCRGLMTWTVVIAALAVLLPLLEDEPDVGVHLWTWCAVGVTCLVALGVIHFKFPPAFDFTPRSTNVDYAFCSGAYASAFAMVNLDAAWVEVDAVQMRDELMNLTRESE